jgi:hypothetical protein
MVFLTRNIKKWYLMVLCRKITYMQTSASQQRATHLHQHLAMSKDNVLVEERKYSAPNYWERPWILVNTLQCRG